MRTAQELQSLIKIEKTNIDRANRDCKRNAFIKARERHNALVAEYNRNYGNTDVVGILENAERDDIKRFTEKVFSIKIKLDSLVGDIVDANGMLKKYADDSAFTMLEDFQSMSRKISEMHNYLFSKEGSDIDDSVKDASDDISLMFDTQVKLKLGKLIA